MRIRWRSTSEGRLDAHLPDGTVAGSLKLHRTYPDGRETWVLSSDTMRRYGELYGIGSQALSTWKRRLSGTIRYRLAREAMASGTSIAKAER